MATLNAHRRRKLQKKQFALPGKRKYPIHDKAHARAALSYAARSDTEGSEDTVRKAVLQKYPSLKKSGGKAKGKKLPPWMMHNRR
jgi:hypothetical protein